MGKVFIKAIFCFVTSIVMAQTASGRTDIHPSSSPVSAEPSATFSGEGASGGKRLDDMSILIIFDDSLRADHLGCYGYSRNTSPHLDALAAEATVFEKAISASSYTCESISAAFSGLLPSMSGVSAGWFATPSGTRENLAELFTKAGYVTGYFTDWAALHDPSFDKGFTETDHMVREYGVSGNGNALSHRVLDFLARHVQRKTLTCIHYADPHDPYAPSDELYLRFADHIFPSPLTLNQIKQNITSLVASGFGAGDERFEDFVLRYDAEIAGIDDDIQTLMEGLDALGRLDETLIVFTADHGQQFLEHGFVAHACHLYRESVNVPLFFWAPGIFPAQRIGEYVSLVNLLPTLLEITGIPNSRSDCYGSSLFNRSGNAVVFVPPAEPIISELLLETRSIVRTIIQGGYKYAAAQRWFTPAQLSQIHVVHATEIEALRNEQYPLVDPWGPVVYEELFDLSVDPGEQNSVIGDHPDEVAVFRTLLDEYKIRCLGSAQESIRASLRPRPPDPNATIATLTGIAPSEGSARGGTRVTLRGANLLDAWILFDGVAGSGATIDPDGSRVTVTTPPHVSGPVRVTAFTPLGTTYPLAFVYLPPPPTADFTPYPAGGDVPLAVHFVDTSSTESSPIQEWQWDFGDGQTSSEQSPVHLYTDPGAYTVTLTVTSENGSQSRSRHWCIDAGHVLPAVGQVGGFLVAILVTTLGVQLIRGRRLLRECPSRRVGGAVTSIR